MGKKKTATKGSGGQNKMSLCKVLAVLTALSAAALSYWVLRPIEMEFVGKELLPNNVKI